ncbi:hypothetical protein APSETT445_008503 [Aspergillus pseudonomiae]
MVFSINLGNSNIDRSNFRHFNDHAISSFEDTDRVDNSTFLVIDDACVASYMGDSYSAATEFIPSGDHSGFVLAVDAQYDPKEGIERPDESPGYYGQMRILGNLIWGDLYAMLSSQSALLEDLWPLAINHPNGVYTGPTVPMQFPLLLSTEPSGNPHSISP